MAFCVPNAGILDGKRRGFFDRAIGAQQQERAPLASGDVEVGEIEIARYAELLRQCSRTRNLAQGKHVHSMLIEKEQDQGTFLGNLTVQMYAKCGHLDDARAVFERILQKNLYSWSIMIAAYVENGNFWEALGTFRWMQQEGMKPDEVTIISLLRACSAVKSLAEGEKLHAAVVELDLELSVKVENSLIALYGKCGNIQYARWVFDTMEDRDIVSWNSIIGAYAQRGLVKEAVELYVEMNEQGIEADRITFASIFGACGRLQGHLEEGKALHERLQELGLDLNAVATALITMYGQCGSVEDARKVFDKMRHRSSAVWNSMMAAYSRNGYTRKALDLYWRMEFGGVEKTEISFVSALAACAKAGLLEDGREIHEHIIMSGLESSDTVATALINMYGKCGRIDSARAVFDQAHPSNSLVLWTSMLSAFVQYNQQREAFQLFRKMDLEAIKLDRIALAAVLRACSSLAEVTALEERALYMGYCCYTDVANALISSYGRTGSLINARKIFDRIRSKSVVTWTTMITACCRNDCAHDAIKIFDKMEEGGMRPNEVTYVSVLAACSSVRDLERGKEIHARVTEKKLDENVIVGNSLVRMYGNCQRPVEARAAFERIVAKNSVSWNALASALAQCGRVEEAISVARQMLLQGIRGPELVATLSELITGCSSDIRMSKEERWLRKLDQH